MRVAITGATGLLGRNLLFEIIKQNLDNLDSLKIFILGRNKFGVNIRQRVRQILLDDGFSYLSLSGERAEEVNTRLEDVITCIEADLDEHKMDIRPGDLGQLKAAPIDLFFHVAALTDFRNAPNVIDALKRTNFHGTQQVLELASSLEVGEFCYVGTAYSCGETSGDIAPDLIDQSKKFRNPYEKTKLEAELLVRDLFRKTGKRCRYFRPSTICGRLIEPPLGAINKFDVFYSWAAFFLHMKLKRLGTWKDKYTDPVDLDLRICYSPDSGLNIVPADYAAKVMYQVCVQGDPGESYHLVNEQETPHSVYIPNMLKTLNIRGTKKTDRVPEEMNGLERFYYKTVGRVFTPYITSGPMLFSTKNLRKVLDRAGLSCPAVEDERFSLLMERAKERDFGVIVQGIKEK